MKEFSISKQDYTRLVNSINLTRKMRRIALNAENLGLSTEDLQAKEQTVLMHAETIAIPTAGILIAYMSGQPVKEAQDKFDAIFSTFDARYGEIPPLFSYENHANKVSSFTNFPSDANLMCLNVEGFFEEQYAKINNIGLPFTKLLSSNVGIIAPLSSDYLSAVFHREAVTQLVQPDCFEVKPTAIDRSTRRAIMPQDRDKQPVFAKKSTIGIYIDHNLEGTTASVVYDATKKIYPEKVIYGAGAKKKLNH